MATKPTALRVQPHGIPDALKQETRWVCWRYELRRGSDRWAKILCTPQGHHAKSNDSSTWTTFADALAAYQRGSFDGIGFCLGGGWAGIDLDHVDEQALTVIAHLSTIQQAHLYFERSPSGNGYKVIGRAARMGGEINFQSDPPAKTNWTGARFFTITGHGVGDPMSDLTDIIELWFPRARKSHEILAAAHHEGRPDFIRDGSRGMTLFNQRTDDDALLLAATAVNREKFVQLFRGDITGYDGDRSRADQALTNILVYWCNGDLEQADRLFRLSALYRDKWESRSYRHATLQKSLRLFMEAMA